MRKKPKYVFIVGKKGAKIGRLHKFNTLNQAKEARRDYKVGLGLNVSKIVRTTRF